MADGLAHLDDVARRHWPLVGSSRRGRRPITIGLVNNMPDAALAATEAQFRRLIQAGAQSREGGDRDVRLKLFSIPEILRSDAARDAMRGRYASTDTLPGSGVDALIVTGAEPLAADLRDEPYWPSLAALVDWAQANTASTLWSCLAAHAAVLHLDGIERRRLPAKYSGVFRMQKAASHPLLTGHAGPLLVPHSRLNGLDEAELEAKGYTVLSRSPDIGVDTFVRQTQSLFVFFQGHPEYDADSLMLEYRRDLRRFLRGERQTHPGVPTGYFEPAIDAALLAQAEKATRDPDPSALSDCSKILTSAAPKGRWMASTARLYRNWLDLVAERAEARLTA